MGCRFGFVATCLWGQESKCGLFGVKYLRGPSERPLPRAHAPARDTCGQQPDHTFLPALAAKTRGLRKAARAQCSSQAPGQPSRWMRRDSQLPGCCCTPAQAPRMLHPNPELPGPPPYAGPPQGSLGDEAGSPAFRSCPSSSRGLSPRRHQGLAMVRDLPLPPTGQGQGTTATSSPGGSMGPPGRGRAPPGPLARTPHWEPQPLHGVGPGGGL